MQIKYYLSTEPISDTEKAEVGDYANYPVYYEIKAKEKIQIVENFI